MNTDKSMRIKKKETNETRPISKGLRKKKRKEAYAIYINRKLKSINATIGLTRKALLILNSLCLDIFDRILTEASRIMRFRKKVTLSSYEIQVATRIVFGGELATHAISEGTKACTKFIASIMLLECNLFLCKLTELYDSAKVTNKKSVWITYKKHYVNDEGIWKKKNKESQLDLIPVCLVRATNGTIKISTMVERDQLHQFISCMSSVMRSGMNDIKNYEQINSNMT